MQSYENRLMRVLRYIYDNPAGDLSLDRLAEEAALSRFHWHRVFHAMTGETCAQAVRRVRLHRAAVMLLTGTAPGDQVAQKVGYDNARSFNRAFAAQYGLSPSEFRKQGCHPAPLLTRQKGEYAMFPVEIKSQPKRVVIGLMHKGEYSGIGVAFEQFFGLCQTRNLWGQVGCPQAVYLNHPDATPVDGLRTLAGAEFHGDVVPEGLQTLTLDAGRCAVMTYKGHYAGIQSAYQSLFGDWLPQSGALPADAPIYEIYRNNPRDTAPEDLVTEICLPLKEPEND